MGKALALLFFTIAFGTRAEASPTTGMAALQFYVGTWSCLSGAIGRVPNKATLTYTIDSGVMREYLILPAQGKMSKPYVASIATAYDAKSGRYVQTGLESDASWWVAAAKPWAGNTEQWTYRLTAGGEVGHSQVDRIDRNAFTYTGYPTLTAANPVFKMTCHRL